MKINSNFIVRNSEDEHYIVAAGGSGFNGLVKMNRTAGFICQCLTEDTTEEKIADRMLETYVVDRVTALEAVRKVVKELRTIGAIDD